jgi:ribosomal protein S18 acetylase RimI-like enzyme
MRMTAQAAWSKGVFGVEKSLEEEGEIARMRENIAQQGALWRVIMVGDAVAGQIWCSLHEYDGVRYGVVDELDVHPDFRRRGVAQALMIDALRRFQSEGAAMARLHTDDGNRNGAKSLYEKIGFRRVKTFPRYRKAIEV